MNEDSQPHEIDAEATWIQAQITTILDTQAKRLRLCARSKRWWCEDIKTQRKVVGREVNRWDTNRDNASRLKQEQKTLKRMIRSAKKECWEKYIQEAQGSEVWEVVNFTKPPRSATTMSAIREGTGPPASSVGEKREMMARVAWPPQNAWQGAGER